MCHSLPLINAKKKKILKIKTVSSSVNYVVFFFFFFAYSGVPVGVQCRGFAA